MTLNGIVALILRFFAEFGSFRGALHKMVKDVAVKKSARLLSHLLMSFLLSFAAMSRTEIAEYIQAILVLFLDVCRAVRIAVMLNDRLLKLDACGLSDSGILMCCCAVKKLLTHSLTRVNCVQTS